METEEKDRLEKAEERIAQGDLYTAQNLLNMIDGQSGRKYYLQSKIYQKKKWYNEQRKQLKKAVKAEPDNEDYKRELTELSEFSKSPEYKNTAERPPMGETSKFCMDCCIDCCYTGV